MLISLARVASSVGVVVLVVLVLHVCVPVHGQELTELVPCYLLTKRGIIRGKSDATIPMNLLRVLTALRVNLSSYWWTLRCGEPITSLIAVDGS